MSARADRQVYVVGAPLPMADYERLLEIGRERGLVFKRSGRVNEGATARHLLRLGMVAERGDVATGAVVGEGVARE